MATMLGQRIEHEVGPSGTVVVQTFDAPIRARPSGDGWVRIQCDRPLDDEYRLETGPGRLELRPIQGHWPFGWRRDRSPLTVEVPVGATVRLDSGSGGIDAEGFVGDQRYRTASGAVQVRPSGGDITIESASGAARLLADEPVLVRVRTASGDIDVGAPRLRSLEARTMSGRVDVDAAVDEPGPYTIETVSGGATLALSGPAAVDAASVSGDLRSELPHAAGGGVGLRTMTVSGPGPAIRFRSVSGGLRVLGRAGSARSATTAPAAAPTATTPGPGPATGARSEERLGILRALERGEIDVAEAERRLSAIDPRAGGPHGGEPAGLGAARFYDLA